MISVKVGDNLPEITRFYGIIIKIFLTREQNPPHFHAVYGEYNGSFDINTLELIEGDLPKKAQNLVREWAEMYKDEIMKMWNTKIIKKLPPLNKGGVMLFQGVRIWVFLKKYGKYIRLTIWF